MSDIRNRLACFIANFALNHIADAKYRDTIGGAILYGMRSAALDAKTRQRIVFDHATGEVRRESTRGPFAI